MDWPADSGCDSADDDSEMETQDVFFDGFEDGALDGWTLSGPGDAWKASTLTAYEGAWSAMAKMTGAGEPSYMEALVSEEDQETLTLSYHRKLVGLDTADDFEAAYYAEGQWVSLEHLGDGRASDGAFVEKSYNIPPSTEKIRFMCECGAVSEQCYLDVPKLPQAPPCSPRRCRRAIDSTVRNTSPASSGGRQRAAFQLSRSSVATSASTPCHSR